MRVTCKHCGGAHPAFDCKKSTAARKDVQVIEVGQRPATVGESQNIAVSPKDRDTADHTAKTEKTGSRCRALPVDANSEHRENEGFGHFTSKNVSGTTSAGTVGNEDRQPIPKRARGRPRTITDMKVYKAMKQREYRERKKNERE